MKDSKDVNYVFVKGTVNYFPVNEMVKSWCFAENIESENDTAYKEAKLANAMAEIAEINGVSANQLQHLFPAVLKMLNHKSDWTK